MGTVGHSIVGEACRDPDNLNRIASSLVEHLYFLSGGHQFESPAGLTELGKVLLKVEGPGQVFYIGAQTEYYLGTFSLNTHIQMSTHTSTHSQNHAQME